MKFVAVATAVAFTMVSFSANALTLKKGEVLSSDGKVVAAASTKTAKAMMEKKGYHISGGQVHIMVAGNAVSVNLVDLQGKSNESIKAIIGEEAMASLEERAEGVNSFEEAVAEFGQDFAEQMQEVYEATEAAMDNRSLNEVIAEVGAENIHEYLSSPDSSEAAHAEWNNDNAIVADLAGKGDWDAIKDMADGGSYAAQKVYDKFN